MPSWYGLGYVGKKRKRYASSSDEESNSSFEEYSFDSYDEDDELPHYHNSHYDDFSSEESEESEISDDERFSRKRNFNDWRQRSSYISSRNNSNFRRNYSPYYGNNYSYKKFNYFQKFDNPQNSSFGNSGRYSNNNIAKNHKRETVSAGKQYTPSTIIRRYINNIDSNDSTIELSQLVIPDKFLDSLINNIKTKRHLARIVIDTLELDNEKSWVSLIQSFATHPELTHIEIVNCELLSSAIEVLASIAGQLPHVISLILNHNKIGSMGLKFLENFYEKSRNLEVLKIADNALDSSGIKIYLKNILRKNNGLRVLDISENENLGAISLDEILIPLTQANCHLTHLILNNTGIKLEGARELAKIIEHNKTLEEIELRYNEIKDQGMLLIFQALETNTKLNYLDVSYNYLTERGSDNCLEILKRIKLKKNSFPNIVLYQNLNAKSENQFSRQSIVEYNAIYNNYEESYYRKSLKNSIAGKDTYLFYDLETTGTNPCFDQIIQFAAIKTDAKFKEQERYNFYVHLNPDNVPNPIALYGNNIPISRLLGNLDVSVEQKTKIYPEFEAVHKIFEILSSATVIAGFNTLIFDNQFLRFSFYRNFISPYELENKAIQLDLFPMITLYKMLNNQSLHYPSDQSLRLEDLQEENNLSSGKAHDALVDVDTTLHLAKYMSSDQPLWLLLLEQFNPEKVLQRIDSAKVQQDGYLLYGNDLRPVFLLANPSNHSSKRKTAKFFFILLDQIEFESVKQAEQAIASITVCKKLIDKKFILTSSFDALLFGRLKLVLDKELIEKNKTWLNNAANAELLKKIRQLVDKPFPDTIWDLDADLYDSKNNIESEKAEISMLFNFEVLVLRQTNVNRKRDFLLEVLRNDRIDNRYRLYTRILRLLARNYPGGLEPKHNEEFARFMEDLFRYNKQLINFKQQSKTMPLEALKIRKQIKKLLRPKQHQKELLKELKNYIEQTFPSPLTGHKKRTIYTYHDKESGLIHLRLVHIDTNTEAGFMMLKVSRKELVSVLLGAKDEGIKRKALKDEFQAALDKGYLKKPTEMVKDDYLTSVEGYEYYLNAYLTSNMPLGYKTASLYAVQKGVNLELYAIKKGKLCLDKRIKIKANVKTDNENNIASAYMADETIRLFVESNKYFKYQLMQKIDKSLGNLTDETKSSAIQTKSYTQRASTKRQKTNHVPQNKAISSGAKNINLVSLNNNPDLSFFSTTQTVESVPSSTLTRFTGSNSIRPPNKIIPSLNTPIEKPKFLNEIPAFKYIEVPGDGHCLFHAVGLYLGKDQRILRNDVASYMEKNLNEFQEFIGLSRNQTIQNYIQAVRAGEEWADHIEIEILMRALKRPIIIVHPDKDVTNLERIQDFKGEPIFVYYKDSIHYDALLVKSQFTSEYALQQLNQLKASRNQTLLNIRIL